MPELEPSVSRLIDETVVVQVLGSPPQLVAITEAVAPVLPGEPHDEVLINPGGVPVVATLAVPPVQVVAHPQAEIIVTAFQQGLPGLHTAELDLIVQTAETTAQAVADAAIQAVLDAGGNAIRYDQPQALTSEQIQQAWDNLNLADVDLDLVALMDAAL